MNAMMEARKFIPEVLASYPRRSAGIPNASGTLVLYTVTTYHIVAKRKTCQVNVLRLSDQSSYLCSNDASEYGHQWLGDTDEILYLRKAQDGKLELWYCYAPDKRCVWKSDHLVGTITGTASDVRTTSLKNGNIGLTFVAPVTKAGIIYSAQIGSSEPGYREYEAQPVRAWNQWTPSGQSALFFTALEKLSSGRWTLCNQMANALHGSGLQYPICVAAVHGETGSHTISSRGILISTIPSSVNLGTSLTQNVYFIALETYQEVLPQLRRIRVVDYEGSLQCPTLSADGRYAAFIVNRTKTGRSMSYKAIGFASLDQPISPSGEVSIVASLSKFMDNRLKTAPIWDRRPDDLLWSADNRELYVSADEAGRTKIFRLRVPEAVLNGGSGTSEFADCPTQISVDAVGSISHIALLSRNDALSRELLVTSSTITSSSSYSILLSNQTVETSIIRDAHYTPSALGLDALGLDSLDIPSEGGRSIQSWLVCPSQFSTKQKYPLLMIIHGGPQSASNNAWSLRWNFALFAEQGYIVLAPNITGSSGFGLESMIEVEGDFAGRPYRDIEACYEWVGSNLEYVDMSRTALAGFSYGGFMANWIAGHDLGKKLRTVVVHNGIFNWPSMLATDFTAGWDDAMGAALWDDPALWAKWSPSSYVDKWSVPMLIIHSERDYRVPIEQGLAAYNVCKAKGIESRFLCFKNECHWVTDEENSLKWYRTVLGWLNRHCGVEDGVRLDDI